MVTHALTAGMRYQDGTRTTMGQDHSAVLAKALKNLYMFNFPQ